MKLLFDENLAAKLLHELSDLYPGSDHVLALGLGGASDSMIWKHAIDGGFVLVTKDEDFQRFSVGLILHAHDREQPDFTGAGHVCSSVTEVLRRTPLPWPP